MALNLLDFRYHTLWLQLVVHVSLWFHCAEFGLRS